MGKEEENDTGILEGRMADFLRRHGYRVPENEEEARELRRAHDLLLGAVAAKRTMGTKARAAFAWTVVAVLTAAAIQELWGSLAPFFSGLLGGGAK